MVHTPFKNALLDAGLPLDLGERRVLVNLNVPWSFYHQDPDTEELPTMAFSGNELGDFAYARKLGHELTVHDFKVLLTAVTPTHPALQVSVEAKVDYQPSKGTEWGNQVGEEVPEPQELTLIGGIGEDAATLELTVTSKGAPKGTWRSAFGEPNVALANTKMLMQLSEQSYQDATARGVKRVHVEGEATLQMLEGETSKKLHLPAQGHLDILKPQDSRLVCGSGSFIFDVESKLPSDYRRVQLAFNIKTDDLKKFEMHAVEKYAVFSKVGIAGLRRNLDTLGILLGPTPFEITQMTPDRVFLDHGRSAPFQLKYAANYFDQKYESPLSFSLEDMNRARKGIYSVSQGKAYNCDENALLEIGFGYKSIQDAKERCDLMESCKSFLLGTDAKAWFCSQPPKDSLDKAGYSTAELTSSTTQLMNAPDMASFVRLGIAEIFPELITKRFEQFGIMISNKFAFR